MKRNEIHFAEDEPGKSGVISGQFFVIVIATCSVDDVMFVIVYVFVFRHAQFLRCFDLHQPSESH